MPNSEKFGEKIESEKSVDIKELTSVSNEQDFKEMIEFRKIKPEDFWIIERLFHFPKNLFIEEFHNYFGFARENTVRNLERDINYRKGELEKAKKWGDKKMISWWEQKIEFFTLFFEFAKRYDWYTCNHLNSLFERRKIKK